MVCSLPHTIDEIQALVQKLMDEDMVSQKAIITVQFDNAITVKDDLRKAYEKFNDIPQESRALIDTFLKQESDKDYKMHITMYKESVDEHEIDDEYLTEKEQQQLFLDEEALRETLEEETRAEKEWKERIREEQAHDEFFRLEFGVQSDSESY
ncbi:hypothetical protein Tco_0434630 [Tanacetum coccineum]